MTPCQTLEIMKRDCNKVVLGSLKGLRLPPCHQIHGQQIQNHVHLVNRLPEIRMTHCLLRPVNLESTLYFFEAIALNDGVRIV